MANIDIDIDEYIDEASDYMLVKELKRRTKRNNKSIIEAFRELQEEDGEDVEYWPEIKTLLDKQKRDWVNENWEEIKP